MNSCCISTFNVILFQSCHPPVCGISTDPISIPFILSRCSSMVPSPKALATLAVKVRHLLKIHTSDLDIVTVFNIAHIHTAFTARFRLYIRMTSRLSPPLFVYTDSACRSDKLLSVRLPTKGVSESYRLDYRSFSPRK